MIDFESEFIKSQGQPFAIDGKEYYMCYSIHVPKETWIKIKFISAISAPRQGVRVDADKPLEWRNRKGNSINIWYPYKKEEHETTIFCPEETSINVRNIWDNGDGVVQSWHGGGAMIVEENNGNRLFCCNSTLTNDRCSDCIFRILFQ